MASSDRFKCYRHVSSIVMKLQEKMLQHAEVLRTSAHGLVVSLSGVELYVSPHIKSSGCEHCADTAEMHVTYNRTTDDRIERHGEADPLNLRDR